MEYKSIQQNVGNLRAHQKEAKAKIFAAWDEVDAVMLQMPTGTGKTFLFTSLIKDIINHYKTTRTTLNILVVAHRTELLDQISASLHKYDIPHGFIQGSREQHLWQRVQVASIFSILTSRNELNVRRKNFDYIIIDEAHHSLADTYKRLFETFPEAKKLGVTATPWRFNHEPFTSLYQTLIMTPQVSWFIKEGLLADFDYVSIRPDSSIQQLVNCTEVSTTGDFVGSELDIAFNNQRIRAKVYDSYKKYADGRKGIVYAINKEHAANLAALYCSKGINAVAIDCDTPKEERKTLIEEFKRGVIKVLVNVEIFTEGFDCPDVNFIQLARPTRSLALYLQQVGRGLRVVEGKERTIIIDNVGLYNYFGLPDANRKWLYHFNGQEDFKEIVKSEYSRDIERKILERSYDEDDEAMMIVRGAGETEAIVAEEKETYEAPLPITEFSLCDYYLLIGNKGRFKLYPFVKKKGKATNQVGNCVYAYDEKEKNLVLTTDHVENLKLINQHSKEKNLLVFLGTLVGKTCRQLLNINQMQELIGEACSYSLSFYELLLLVERWYEFSQRDEKDV
jgi:superfamily II DNA or RNA helicase